MEGIRCGNYDVYPSGRPLIDKDGSPPKWMACAEIIRWSGNEAPPVLMLTWDPPKYPEFETEQEATEYAALASKELIDSGQCKI